MEKRDNDAADEKTPKRIKKFVDEVHQDEMVNIQADFERWKEQVDYANQSHELAKEHLQLLLQDVQAWKEKLRKTCMIPGQTPSGDWKLVFYAKAFKKRSGFANRDLFSHPEAPLEWLTRNAPDCPAEENVVVLGMAKHYADLFPASPIASKRLQLFGLPFLICGAGTKPPKTPEAAGIWCPYVSLLELTRNRLPELEQQPIYPKSLANEEYVNMLFHTMIPPGHDIFESSIKALELHILKAQSRLLKLQRQQVYQIYIPDMWVHVNKRWGPS